MIPVARPHIGEEEKRAVMEVLDSGMLVQGPRVREFETRFAAFSGSAHAAAVSNGTAALHMALLAHGVGPGDEVITTPFSFVASASAILMTGAKPVFADIEPDTYCIDPAQIRARITTRTKALVPVHLYGQISDMEPIAAIAQEYGLAIVEDACQAHGASLNGKPVGAWGTACYSFYATKNMTTIEGGMITSNDPAFDAKVRLLRDHGSPRRYEHVSLGYNMRLTDLQAALGLTQLARLAEWNCRRQENAAGLNRRLANVKGVSLPVVRPGAVHVYHQYTLRVAEREALIERLKEAGVGYGIHYPTPIHRQPLFLGLGYYDSLPISERASQEVLSLPVHPALTEADLDVIASAVAGA
jgi:dTDP-4-amino-4,6-dideoxygalactose transaminase